jgi:hypothetical protein
MIILIDTGNPVIFLRDGSMLLSLTKKGPAFPEKLISP